MNYSTRALLVAATLTTTAASAQMVNYKGHGAISCPAYLEIRAQNSPIEELALAAWVAGYMSGFNMETKSAPIVQFPDTASTLAFLDRHCRQKPLDNVLMATDALIDRVREKK